MENTRKLKEMYWLEAVKQNNPPPKKITKTKIKQKNNGFNNFKIKHRSV